MPKFAAFRLGKKIVAGSTEKTTKGYFIQQNTIRHQSFTERLANKVPLSLQKSDALIARSFLRNLFHRRHIFPYLAFFSEPTTNKLNLVNPTIKLLLLHYREFQ